MGEEEYTEQEQQQTTTSTRKPSIKQLQEQETERRRAAFYGTPTPEKGSSRERLKAANQAMYDWWRFDRDNLAYTDETKTTPETGEWSDFGNSSHDAANIMAPTYGQGELNEMRANDQGFWEKVGLGAAKMATTAGTTFLDNTVGFLWGIGSAVWNRDASRIYDNDFTNAMADFNEWCEKEMPHYSSKYEGWGLDFWGNFIGKDILANAGFQIGTGLSMLVPGALMKVPANSFKATKMLSNFMKTGKAFNTGNAAKDLILSTYAAVGEAGMEGLNNKRDFIEFQTQAADDEFRQQSAQLDMEWAQLVATKYGGDENAARSSMDFNDYYYKKQDLQRMRADRDKFIQKEAQKVGDMTTLANLALVGGTNFITFGKALTGYSLNKRFGNVVTDIVDAEGKVLKKNVWDRTAENVVRTGKYKVKNENYGKWIRNAEGKLVKDEKKYIEKAAKVATRAKEKSVGWNVAKDMFFEGLEEMNQEAASQYSASIAEEEMMQYEALAKSGLAYDDILKQVNNTWFSFGNLTKALGKVYSDPQQYRQFFGGMLGGVFSPHFSKGADGKMHFHLNNLGQQSAAIREENSTNAMIAEQINTMLNSDESKNYIEGLVRHAAFDRVKQGAVAVDSKMDYENADFGQFVSDVTMMANAGKLGLLQARLEGLRESLNDDDNLQKLCMQFANEETGEDGKKKIVGEFVDKDGNYIGNTDAERLKIRQKLGKRIDQMQKDITLYQKSMNFLDGATGGHLDHQTLATFVWEQAQLMNKYNRARTIIGGKKAKGALSTYLDAVSQRALRAKTALTSTEEKLKNEKDRLSKLTTPDGKPVEPSELQKKLEQDIKELTRVVDITTEVSTLINEMQKLQTETDDHQADKDAVSALFEKYKSIKTAMPNVFSMFKVKDEDEDGNDEEGDKKKDSKDKEFKDFSLMQIMGTGWWATMMDKVCDTDKAESMTADFVDAAKLYLHAQEAEKSLENIIKDPTQWTSQRADFEQRLAEYQNKDVLKVLEKNIEDMLDSGDADHKNLEAKVKEKLQEISSDRTKKLLGKLGSLIGNGDDANSERLIKIAIENVLKKKKYKNFQDLRNFTYEVMARIAMDRHASPEAKQVAMETFNKISEGKKNVNSILKGKPKLKDFNTKALLVEETDEARLQKLEAIKANQPNLPFDQSNYQYTEESKANAAVVQNEAKDLLERVFQAYKEQRYQAELDNPDDVNVTTTNENTEESDEINKQREKLNEKKDNVIRAVEKLLEATMPGEEISKQEDIDELITKALQLIDRTIKTNDYDASLKDDIDDIKAELESQIYSMVDQNLKDRAAKKIRDGLEGDELENAVLIENAFSRINKILNKIQRRLEGVSDNEIFQDVFDSIAVDDGSMEVDYSVEGYYYYNGQVYRGHMVKVPGGYYLVQFSNNGQTIDKSLLVDSHGAVVSEAISGDLLTPAKRGAELPLSEEFVNDALKYGTPNAFSLQRFKELGALAVSSATNASENRTLNKKRQECCQMLIDQGVLDKEGNAVHTNGKLLPAIIQANMIMDENLTQSTNEIKEVIENAKPETAALNINQATDSDGRKYRLFYDVQREEWVRAVLINKDIHYKDESGKTWTRNVKKQLKNKTFDEILREFHGQDTEILSSSKEDWESNYDELTESEKKDVEQLQLEAMFNFKAIDTRKVDIEIVDKPWKNDPTKSNKTIRIYIKGQHQKGYFELVKDHEDGYYSVHFKTATDNADNSKYNSENAEVSTRYERSVLFDQLLNAMPDGARFSTWGSLSPAGVKAVEKLGKMAGNNIVGYREVESKEDGSKIQLPIFRKGEELYGNPDEAFSEKNGMANEQYQEIERKKRGREKTEKKNDHFFEGAENPIQQKKRKQRKASETQRQAAISEFDKQIAELESMEQRLQESAQRNPDYHSTLRTVQTFKQYIEFVKNNYDALGKPKTVVLNETQVVNMMQQLQKQMEKIFGDDVQFLSDEEMQQATKDANNDIQFQTIDAENTDIPFSKSNGETYGFTNEGNVVLNKDKFRPDTPVHEYTHIWDKACMERSPELWKRGVELMKQTDEWQKVIDDPNYANIKDNEDLVASEVHSRLSGMLAAGKAIEISANKRVKKGLLAKLLDWFKKFKDFTLQNVFGMKAEDAQKVTLEQFLSAPVADFLIGTDPRNVGQTEYVQPKQTRRQSKQKTESNFKVGDTVQYAGNYNGRQAVVAKKAVVKSVSDKGVTIEFNGKTLTVNPQYLTRLYGTKPSENREPIIESVSVEEAVARYLADKDLKINDTKKDITDLHRGMSSKEGKTIDEIVLAIKDNMPFNADNDEIRNAVIDIASGRSKKDIARYADDAHYAALDKQWEAEVAVVDASLEQKNTSSTDNPGAQSTELDINSITGEQWFEIFGTERPSDDVIAALMADEDYADMMNQLFSPISNTERNAIDGQIADEMYEQSYQEYLQQFADENGNIPDDVLADIMSEEDYNDYLKQRAKEQSEANFPADFFIPVGDAIRKKVGELGGQVDDIAPGQGFTIQNPDLQAASRRITKNETDTDKLDTFKPSISEYDINNKRETFLQGQKRRWDEQMEEHPEDKSMPDYRFIYDLNQSLGAFDYIKNGNLKPNQEVYIGWGKVGENSKYTYWEPVFFVKDEQGQFQFIGAMSSQSKKDGDAAKNLREKLFEIAGKKSNLTNPNMFKKVVVKAKKGTPTFKVGDKFTFSLYCPNGKFLTTTVSKVLNGSLLFSKEAHSLKEVSLNGKKAVAQAIKDGEQKSVTLGYFNGGMEISGNMETKKAKAAEIAGYRSGASKEKGHVVLLLDKPNGNVQLIPVRVATFGELMNNPSNKFVQDVDEILRKAWEIYQSNNDHNHIKNRLNDKGGLVSQLYSKLHIDNIKLFIESNKSISLRVNEKNKPKDDKGFLPVPKTFEEFAKLFKDQFADCLVNINEDVLQNPETLNKYIVSDVFSTNLESTEFRNAFFTVNPIDISGNPVKMENDMPESIILRRNNLNPQFKPEKVYTQGNADYYVCQDLNGNYNLFAKRQGSFTYDSTDGKELFSQETKYRMISYAMLKKGIQPQDNKDFIMTATVDKGNGEIVEMEVLAHPTPYETWYYDPQAWNRVDGDVKAKPTATTTVATANATPTQGTSGNTQNGESDPIVADKLVAHFTNQKFKEKFLQYESRIGDVEFGRSALGENLSAISESHFRRFANGDYRKIPPQIYQILDAMKQIGFDEKDMKAFIELKRNYDVENLFDDMIASIDFDEDNDSMDIIPSAIQEAMEKNMLKSLESHSESKDESCNIA